MQRAHAALPQADQQALAVRIDQHQAIARTHRHGFHAAQAAAAGTALPPRYFRLMRWWFWFGWPAFSAVLGIFWLMVNKPALW